MTQRYVINIDSLSYSVSTLLKFSYIKWVELRQRAVHILCVKPHDHAWEIPFHDAMATDYLSTCKIITSLWLIMTGSVWTTRPELLSDS